MMNNFKETLVNWSRNKRIKNICWIMAIIGILIFIFTKSKVVEIMTYIGVVAIGIFATWMDAIKQRNEDIVKNNELICIILSDDDVIFFPIWFFIVIPAFYVLGSYLHSIIMSVIVVIVAIRIPHKLSKKISNHFEKKLNIPE